jgi:hypothetical protein
MTPKEINNNEARLKREYKAYKHRQWLQRQNDYQKMIARDSYGLKSSKV